MNQIKTIILDVVFVAIIVLVGWFLIGYYLDYNYLATGYQDWIYHAFRIKSIDQWGIVSWDHKWANGINYWRSYQYIPHLLTLYTAKLFNIGITNAMMLWGVTVYLYLRITGYMLLRYMKVSPHVALGSMLLSYSFSQNWIGISDYSIFIACLLLPFIIYISVKSISKSSYLYMFASVAGISFLFHPIFGLFSAGYYLFVNVLTTKVRNIHSILSLIIFFVSSSPYWLQYVLVSYRFSNPYLNTTNFVNEVALGNYLGLGLWLLLVFVFAYCVSLFADSSNRSWIKVTGTYLLVCIIIFIMSKNSYSLSILNLFQFGRMNLIVGFVIPIFAGVSIDPLIKNATSKFVIGLYSVLIALLIVEAIGVASQNSPLVSNTLHNPIRNYFNTMNVHGSLYFHNESESSYATDWNIRFSGSYNEHLLPSPLSFRFKQLMSGGKSHLIVSSKQIDLINAYSKVLGVEYLVLPIKSPITKTLLSSDTKFIFESDVEVDTAAYSVFRNVDAISYAYIMERNVFDENISMKELEKPNLNSASYNIWDEEIKKLSGLIDSDLVKTLEMDFVNTDELAITVDTLSEFSDPVILITQSYDTNWEVVNNESARISPTSLRFMKIEVGKQLRTSVITLKNSWPDWHWPVQYLGFGSVFVSGISVGLYEIFRKK